MNRAAFMFALLTVLFAGLFTADVMGYFNIASRPIARLRAADGNVRRLAKDQMTWDRAQGGTLFGTGDTIATGEDSQAKLLFYAGGEVEIEPGSMLVLGGEKGEVKLNFVAGTGRVRVSKSAQTKVTVASGSANAPRKSAVIEVAEDDEFDSPDETVAPVAKAVAKAKIAPPTRPPVTVAIQEKSIRNPQKSLSAHGELVSLAQLPPAPRLTFPDRDSIVRLNGNTVPKFQWTLPEIKLAAGTTEPPKFTYEILVRPQQGSGPEKVIRSERASFPIDELNKGKYLWSVRAISADGRRGPASEFRGVEVRVPEHIAKPVIMPVRVE